MKRSLGFICNGIFIITCIDDSNVRNCSFLKALGQSEQQTATNTSNIISNQTSDTANQTDMDEAHQALGNNDTNAILDELKSASGELFQVNSRQFDPAQVETMTQEFDPLPLHIDQAQEVTLKDDYTKTLEQVNSVESELLNIT